MPSLDPAARRALRARAHHLHPVVAIGQHGLTPAVLHEIDIALTAHELVKVRVFSDDRAARETLLDEVCAALDAAPVQHLGKLLVLWRENPDKPRVTAKRPQARAARSGPKAATKGGRRPPAAAAARPPAPAGAGRGSPRTGAGRGSPRAGAGRTSGSGAAERTAGHAAARNRPPAGVPRAALPRRRRARSA